jgi:raffinose/stachyose/melibiose transport system permease protein
MSKRSRTKPVLSILMVIFGLVFILPFFFLVLNVFKPFAEILTSFASFPKTLYLGNLVHVWNIMSYPRVFTNSVIICGISVAGTVLASALAGYKLQREARHLSRVIYYLFIFGMIIPFPVLMVPTLQLMKTLGTTDSLLGVSLLYIALNVSFGVFVIYGFTKSVPMEIEEAAIIDGCPPFGLFWRVVFPLLTPATVTLTVLYLLWIWNDFVVAYLMLNKRELRTITLNQWMFVGEHSIEWDNFITSLVLSTLPIILFYIFAQNRIQKGLTLGSLKG